MDRKNILEFFWIVRRDIGDITYIYPSAVLAVAILIFIGIPVVFTCISVYFITGFVLEVFVLIKLLELTRE